jgi:hypothetical protein
MKRTYRFAQPGGTVVCQTSDGERIIILVVQGILKHASQEALFSLLQDPHIALKYTVEALRIAPWSVLKHFPRDWLLRCMPEAKLPEGRRRALPFMLS